MNVTSHRDVVRSIATRLRNQLGHDLFAEVGTNARDYGQIGRKEQTEAIISLLIQPDRPAEFQPTDEELDLLRQHHSECFNATVPAVHSPPQPTPVPALGPAFNQPVLTPTPITPPSPGTVPDMTNLSIEERRQVLEGLLAQPAPAGVGAEELKEVKKRMDDQDHAIGRIEGDQAATAQIAVDAQTAVGNFTNQIDKVVSAITNAPPPVQRRIAQVVQSPSAGNGQAHQIEKVLLQYASPSMATDPVELTGESGCSKTFLAVKHGAAFDFMTILPGSKGARHSDIVGGKYPYSATELVWKDGYLASAFRSVSIDPISGDRLPGTIEASLLIIDEKNRLNDAEKSVFVTALNQRNHPKTQEPCYVLNTGRMMRAGDPGSPAAAMPWATTAGVAMVEELWAPVHRLAIIATSNEGRGHNISKDDRAEVDRFVKERIFFDKDETKTIVETVLQQYSFPASEANEILDYILVVRNMAFQQADLLEKPISIRLVTRAIRTAGKIDAVKQALVDYTLNHCCKLDDNNVIEEMAKQQIEAAGTTAFPTAGIIVN